jgi:hypothetical protein
VRAERRAEGDDLPARKLLVVFEVVVGAGGFVIGQKVVDRPGEGDLLRVAREERGPDVLADLETIGEVGQEQSAKRMRSL